MPLKPGPRYWWNAQPPGQGAPVAFGPLSGPLQRRRSNTPMWPLASETQTRPCLAISPPRGPKPGIGTLYISASDLCGFLVGSMRTTAPGLPRSVPHTEPSVGLAMTAEKVGRMRMSLVGSMGLPGSVYSSRTPLPLVSSTSAVQPCDFSMSPVSSSILVLIQPTFPPPPPVLAQIASCAAYAH